jgi:hypothetical protein
MSGADLFVVCKNPDCGAEVSPYVTECPYCGTRLQKRAPKLDKGLQPAHRSRRVPAPSLGRLRPGEIPGIRADSSPYVTGAIILATAVFWIATRASWLDAANLVAIARRSRRTGRASSRRPSPTSTARAARRWGAASTSSRRCLRSPCSAGCSSAATAASRSRRCFWLGAIGGTAVAVLAGPSTPVAGANGGALALLCAWAVPDLLARRRRRDYDGDLLGTGVIALVLLALPIARPEASPIAGGVGVVIGYLGGLALAQRRMP